jgi:hypothetical protein
LEEFDLAMITLNLQFKKLNKWHTLWQMQCSITHLSGRSSEGKHPSQSKFLYSLELAHSALSPATPDVGNDSGYNSMPTSLTSEGDPAPCHPVPVSLVPQELLKQDIVSFKVAREPAFVPRGRSDLRAVDHKVNQRIKHPHPSQPDKTDPPSGNHTSQSIEYHFIPLGASESDAILDEASRINRELTAESEIIGSVQDMAGNVTKEESSSGIADNMSIKEGPSVTGKAILEPIAHQGGSSAGVDKPTDDDNMSNASDCPRSPSPWQELQQRIGDETDNCARANLILYFLRWIYHSRLGGIGYPSTSDASSIIGLDKPPYDGASTGDTIGESSHTQSDTSNNDGSPAAPSLSLGRTDSLGKREAGSQGERSDQSLAGNKDQKRVRTDSYTASNVNYICTRYACPYQKHDPVGSPYCCMP